MPIAELLERAEEGRSLGTGAEPARAARERADSPELGAGAHWIGARWRRDRGVGVDVVSFLLEVGEDLADCAIVGRLTTRDLSRRTQTRSRLAASADVDEAIRRWNPIRSRCREPPAKATRSGSSN